jgi:hypothetical protein
MSIIISNKIKKLLFTAALLVPGAAYAANPSASFTDQVVPAGSDPIACGASPLGDAAADVAAAGFTTCALYSDFTTQIPNAVGTGTPDNWLWCDKTTNPAAGIIWAWEQGTNADSRGNTIPCVSGHTATSANSGVFQTTDPVNGNLALEFAADNAHCNVLLYNCNPEIATYYSGAAPYAGFYPQMYMEMAIRTDNPANGFSYETAAMTGWVSDGEIGRNTSPSCPTCFTEPELDGVETGTSTWDSALHFWVNGSGSGPNQVANGSLTDTGYHTWGALWLGDGNGNVEWCSYKDGVRQGCFRSVAEPASSLINMRHYIEIDNSAGTQATHNFLKYVKVFTCANWMDSSLNGMCTTNSATWP